MSLAEQQTALMTALSGHGAMPEGFRLDRLEATRSALARKRMRAAGRAWPALMQLLGESFPQTFTLYARANPLPQDGGPLADGRAFVAWLSKSRPLTDEIHLKALQFDVLNKRHAQGWRARKWAHAGCVWLPESRRWVVGLGVPGGTPWRAWSVSLAWRSFRPWRQR